ncbi:MAG: hypothetical protein R3Y26_05930 [Rikenellaceae bacterium]
MKKSLYIILCASLGVCYNSDAQNRLTDTARLKMHDKLSDDSTINERDQFRTNPQMKYKIDSTIAQQYVVHSGDSLKLDLTLDRAIKLRILEENYKRIVQHITKINAEARKEN